MLFRDLKLRLAKYSLIKMSLSGNNNFDGCFFKSMRDASWIKSARMFAFFKSQTRESRKIIGMLSVRCLINFGLSIAEDVFSVIF